MRKFLLFLCFLNLIQVCYPVTKKILILSFKNKGRAESGQITGLIEQTLFSLFNATGKYEAFRTDIKEHIQPGILPIQNNPQISSLINKIKPDLVLQGEYFDDGQEFIINTSIIDLSDREKVYEKMIKSKSGILIYDTIDRIREMVEQYTGLKLSLATLDIKTNYPCRIFINEKEYGFSPLQIRLSQGEHKIKLKYKENKEYLKIYDKVLHFSENEKKIISLPVYIPLEITAAKTCQVFINNQFLGNTPLKKPILQGQDFLLKIIFRTKKNKDYNIFEEKISVVDKHELKYHFSLAGSVSVKNNIMTLKGGILGYSYTPLPNIINNLPAGYYRVKAFYHDQKKKFDFVFYNKKHFLEPGQDLIIDLNHIEYNQLWGFAFLPGAAQIHNRQPVKGGILLAGFLTGLTMAGLSPLISYLNYYFDYREKAISWNTDSANTIYSMNDINEARYRPGYLLQGFLISGLGLSLLFWLISLADGLYTMEYLYKKLYKTQKKSILFIPGLRFCLQANKN